MSANKSLLLHEAENYSKLGYAVGLTLGKALIGSFKYGVSDPWDGISFLLNDMVCVDFDTPSMDIGEFLPPTLKEKSPRGYHLFYQLPRGGIYEPKINWKSKVDLLVVSNAKKPSKYSLKESDECPWGGHVLCSPSSGYVRIYPDDIEPLSKLTMAPNWLILELSLPS